MYFFPQNYLNPMTMILYTNCTFGLYGKVTKSRVFEAFETLCDAGGFLPLYVRQQNAGILFSRQDDTIHIKSFELSPRNKEVITTLGRLKRTFPGPAIAMDMEAFTEPSLRKSLAETIAKMSNQTFPGTKAKAKKASQEHDEDRDSTNPKMVTEFLPATLYPRCSDVDGLQIEKSTREEVNWQQSRSPWVVNL